MNKFTRWAVFVLASTFFVAILLSMATAAIGYGIDEMQRKYQNQMSLNEGNK